MLPLASRRRAERRPCRGSLYQLSEVFGLIAKMTSRFEIPRRLRAIVRARESSLIALAALVGALSGVVVAAMGTGVDLLHRLLFQLDAGVRLSGLLRLDPVLAISVPLGGGLAVRHRRGNHRALAAGAGGRSDRGECAAWRPHVASRQHHRRGADGLVERGRRLGRPRGRLYPAGERSLPRASAPHSGCGAPICASWSVAAPPEELPAPSVRRSPALSTASN